ncbi:MAG: GxxExxY protein [Phycisphaerales bacterium]|nr:GxxExxY protein [Phycisphaerales bacterium]
MTKDTINKLTYQIIGCAIEVHKNMGPGLLESVYEACLIDELIENGLNVKSQVKIPLYYKDKALNQELKIDLLVEDYIIVELKAVEKMIPLYDAQILTYMKLTERPKGLLINFNTTNIIKDLKQFVNELYRELE